MNTVTVTITAKMEAFPNVPLILKNHNKMKKVLRSIIEGNETKGNHYTFCGEDTQVQANFCTICGNYMYWSLPEKLDEQIVCRDSEHYKMENAKTYKKEMKQTLKKIYNCDVEDKTTLTKELQNMSDMTSEWMNNL